MGGPRARTQETAVHVMLANEEEIDPSDSLKKIKEKISKNLKVGKKIIEDSRLDFNNDGPIGKDLHRAKKEGRVLVFLVEKSDKMAMEKNDAISSTYLRKAGNIAEIILRYSKVSDNILRIQEKSYNLNESIRHLERYLSSHGGVLESFLAKAIEETQGKKERDKFVKNFPQGFENLRGFNIKIYKTMEGKKIIIKYLDRDGEKELRISDDLLEKIISEREEFEKNFN